MDIMSLLMSVLSFLGQVPAVEKYLALVVLIASLAGGIITALVGVWHAGVGVVSALSAIPYLSKLSDVATKMKADEAIIDDFSKSKILPILSQLSMIPLPKKEVI